MRKVLSLVLTAVLVFFVTVLPVKAAQDDTPAKALFRQYITGIYGHDNYMNYEELGKVGDYTYASASAGEMTDTFYTAVLGDYIFRKFWVAFPYELGLYIITDDAVCTLEQAYNMNIITDDHMETVAALTTQGAAVYKLSDNEKAVINYLSENKLYSPTNYGYSEVGKLNGCTVVTAQTNDFEYSEIIGNYRVYSENNPWLFVTGSRIFIIGESGVYSLKEACGNNTVNIEDVRSLCESRYVSSVHFSLPETETEPDTSIMIEEDFAALKRAICFEDSKIRYKDITVDCYILLSNGVHLVHYYTAQTIADSAVHNEWIGKYLYTYKSGFSDRKIFDGSSIYTLRDAYENGKINSAQLKEIYEIFPEMKEYKITLKAGKRSYICKDNLKGLTVSNGGIVKLDKSSGAVTALKKGTVIISAKLKNGKTCTCKVKVTSDPALTKNGKNIKSIPVQKGKTVKIRITGKAQAVNNSYASTKVAKIIAKKTDSVLKIKGLKKGSANLKVTVNGKKLSLKVRVK